MKKANSHSNRIIEIRTLLKAETGEVLFTSSNPLDRVHNDLPRPYEPHGRMRIADAAANYGISCQCIYRYISDGRLPKYIINGKLFVYTDDMENALKTKGKWQKNLNS